MGLSNFQRDALILHLDGPVDLVRGSDRESCAILRERHRLAARGMLRYDNAGRPRTTILTEAGRAALCAALADWAEALARAGGEVEMEISRKGQRWRLNGPFTIPGASSGDAETPAT